MPHATEGELHAWVDGALASVDPERAMALASHLQSCEDCQARLESARAGRDRSAELLSAALGPAAEPPPFETILREAGRTEGGAGGPDRSAAPGARARRVAWAASLVVALGAGWMAHAVLGGDGEEVPAPETRLAVGESRTEEPAGAREGVAQEETESRRPGPDAAVPRPASPEAQTLSVAEPSSADATPGDPAAAKTEGDAIAWRPPMNDGEPSSWLGRDPLIVPELEVIDVTLAETEGARLVRVRQRLSAGGVVELLEMADDVAANRAFFDERADVDQTRAAGYMEAETAPPGRAREPGVAADALTEMWTLADGVRVRATAPVASDSLRVLLSRIR